MQWVGERRGGSLEKGGDGGGWGGSAEQSRAEQECRLFPCVGRAEGAELAAGRCG